AEEHPLPVAESPTANSPRYIPEFDPEEDLVDYPANNDDDDNEEKEESFKDEADDEEEDKNKDEEEEEHPAPADSIPPLPVHHTTTRMPIPVQALTPVWSEAEIDRLLAIPSPLPSPLSPCPSPPSPISPPLPVSYPPLPASPTYPLGYRVVMIRLRAKAPSTSHQLPSRLAGSGGYDTGKGGEIGDGGEGLWGSGDDHGESGDGRDTFKSDSEDSTVIYTKVSRLFEGLSDIASPGVEGPPTMPEDPYAYVVAAF
nr:hypothetical protein [Tanacetum cinerariifolium]